MLENILLTCAIKETFSILINELILIQTEGILFNIEGYVKRVFFLISFIEWRYNLGLNFLYGLHESFNSNHYCRFCREHKSVMEQQTIKWKSFND